MTTYDPAAFILDDSRPEVFVYDTALGGITRMAFERSEHRPDLVVAYVVPSDTALTAADCERHCRQHPLLAPYKRPRAYRFVDELPLTAAGKKLHYRATQQAKTEYAQGLFETAEPSQAIGNNDPNHERRTTT